MTDKLEKKWYVLRVFTGQEKMIKQYIENEIARLKLSDYVSQVIVPTEKVYQIVRGKKISKERNYFPGYIIIEVALIGEIKHIISKIPGVLGFLGKKNEPMPLKLSEINRIFGKMHELAEKQDEKMAEPFIVGETVKIIDGPFNSFTGVIEEINEDKKRLKVSVKIFGRKTPLELSFLQVEKES